MPALSAFTIDDVRPNDVAGETLAIDKKELKTGLLFASLVTEFYRVFDANALRLIRSRPNV